MAALLVISSTILGLVIWHLCVLLWKEKDKNKKLQEDINKEKENE